MGELRAGPKSIASEQSLEIAGRKCENTLLPQMPVKIVETSTVTTSWTALRASDGQKRSLIFTKQHRNVYFVSGALGFGLVVM